MKIKFDVVKDENFDFNLLEAKLLKTFKEVENVAIVEKVEDKIFEKDDVKTYQHPHSQHVKSFCQQCGSALPTLIESIDSVLVPAGSLDSPVPIRPTAQIFVESSVGWLETLDDVPSYATLPVDDKK